VILRGLTPLFQKTFGEARRAPLLFLAQSALARKNFFLIPSLTFARDPERKVGGERSWKKNS